ncbi:4-alpha-glucanotransferase [Thermocoleostomius sinensis]|uniref:4-alpha-glucanotransferase n=1 Tax=Thermocoleostomius sinensis A174 TaxID=2016057 RepID=A0A9E9C8J5_9CYAN|nr:4-alpha-glucanotransferase [Thermocoleostomius sinensis]WAL60378.1 4-alpha-glucanotransferase [Thermocoleostomius sinensis A174]
MPFPRSSGVLLHPSSFPSQFGIGDLGPTAYQFIDFLRAAGQRLWQILPLGPTGYGDSPYQCFSANAGNPLLISPEQLRDIGLLTNDDLRQLPQLPLQVDYGWVIHSKEPLLRKACQQFRSQADASLQQAFADFCQMQADWLEDYALFRSLKDAHRGASWHQWEPPIAHHEPEAVEAWRSKLADEIFYHKFLQFEFSRQWTGLKAYANQNGVEVLGDLPIYLAHDSAEVWAHSDLFCLDSETGLPTQMAGVPPDYFSATGQLWGNPLYNWERMQEDDFNWWIQRFRKLFERVDLVRIDHFRGFEAYWAVPQGEATAINGQWLLAPGKQLFTRLKDELGTLPIIAEDLGVITPEVEALRDEFEFPGMKVLHFAFDSQPDNPYLPFNYTPNCVVYTGTHDNDTTVGWFNKRSPDEQARVQRYLSESSQGIHWDLVRLAFATVANQAIIPLQDVLGLGSEARMNEPSRAAGNWGWRYQADALTEELSDRLRHLTVLYGRFASKR